MTATSRRTVLGLGAAVGAGALVAACGGGGEDPLAAGPGADTSDTASGGSSQPSEAGGESLVRTAEVPVGGGVILADAKVVVTQPTAGDFKAFSSTCTHQSCTVSGIADGRIGCMCHGSRFSIADGTPDRGPATSPLKEIAVAVEGDAVIRT